MKRRETKQQKQRRYYLHKKLREITKVDAWNKQVEVNDRILSQASEAHIKYISELGAYGYNIQTFIE